MELFWVFVGALIGWVLGMIRPRPDVVGNVVFCGFVVIAIRFVYAYWGLRWRKTVLAGGIFILACGFVLARAVPAWIPLEVLTSDHIYAGLQHQSDFHFSGNPAPCAKPGLVHILPPGATLHALANKEVLIELAVGNQAKTLTLEHGRIFIDSTVPGIFIQDKYWRLTEPTTIMTTLRGPVNGTDCLKIDPLKMRFPHAGTFALELTMSGSKLEQVKVPLVISVP